MKRFLLRTVALAAMIAGPAVAADLRAPPPPPAPFFSWTGLYIGGHVGAGWADNEATAITGNQNFPEGFSFPTNHLDGAIAGGQIGLNYQVGTWVWGVEGEYSWSNVKGTDASDSPLILNRRNLSELEQKSLATAAVRLGMTWGTTLWYLKGGAAWAKFDSFSRLLTPTVLLSTSSGSETRTGWLVGIGTEWAIGGGPWSAKLEGQFIDFGTQQVERLVLTGANAGVVNLRDNRMFEYTAKFGLNYRFGWGAGTY
jgi:outer membrane immunogenic protein